MSNVKQPFSLGESIEIVKTTEPEVGFGQKIEIKRIAEIEMFDGDPRYDAVTGAPLNRKSYERVENLITTLGLNYVADNLSLVTGVLNPLGMKLGGSAVAASLGDTDILTDLVVSGDFQAWASGYPIDGGTTVAWRAFWAAGDATASGINEVVMKSADGTSDAINRITFTTQNKGASDTLQITVTWTLQNA